MSDENNNENNNDNDNNNNNNNNGNEIENEQFYKASFSHHIQDLPPMKRLLLDIINPRGDLSISPTLVHSQVVLLLVALSPCPRETISNAIQVVDRTA